MPFCRVVALAVAVLLAMPATEAAARTKRQSAADDSGYALLLTGPIGPGSYEQFHDAIRSKRPKLIVLQSPGGLFGESIVIADEVRRLGISTMVAENGECASGCALIFLSGKNRYAGPRAKIGLHAASNALTGKTDGRTTAFMAAYLSQVGVSRKTLKRMAATAPTGITWLSASEMKALRIKPPPRF